MFERMRSVVVLFVLAVAAATAASGTPAVAPRPAPGEGRLVEYEVTLRQVPATDAASVLLRVAAAHHGIVTKLDADGRRATVTLPASRGAGLKEDPLVTATLSNGTSSRRIDRLKPVTMTTPLGGSGTYLYDGAGNIKSIGGDNFTYDAVNRLTSGTVRPWKLNAVGTTQTYTYDQFGNRLTGDALNHGCAESMDCAIEVTIDAKTNRMSSAKAGATDIPVGYDDAGNVTSFAGTTFGYDALGSMVTRNDGQGPQYVYDANDERVGVLSTKTSSWTWTLRDVTGRQLREYTAVAAAGRTNWSSTNWTWTRDHIYRGGQLLASVTPSGNGTVTQHMHLDHLGAARVITQDGMPVGMKAYYPFGEEQASTPVETPEENHKFTGHERDDVSNGRFTTDYMHARYYSATAGRFFSVDPVLNIEGSIHKPQAWNRYAYVMNNPIRYTDPNGRECGACVAFERDNQNLLYGRISVEEFNARNAAFRERSFYRHDGARWVRCGTRTCRWRSGSISRL